jgi:hypothetical protein
MVECLFFEHLLCKCKALSLNPSPTKKKKINVTIGHREASIKSVKNLVCHIHEQKKKKTIRDTLYKIKETMITTGQGEQTAIVPN